MLNGTKNRGLYERVITKTCRENGKGFESQILTLTKKVEELSSKVETLEETISSNATGQTQTNTRSIV